MTHRKRKLLAAYLDDEHIGTGTFTELEEITTLKRSTLSNIVRLGHKRYRIEHIGNAIKYIARAPHKGSYIEDLEKAENYLHRVLRGVWNE